MEFECRRKNKTESEKGILYKVSFRNPEGHTLTLCSSTSAIFEGYEIGGKITVDITNPQKVLGEKEQ